MILRIQEQTADQLSTCDRTIMRRGTIDDRYRNLVCAGRGTTCEAQGTTCISAADITIDPTMFGWYVSKPLIAFCCVSDGCDPVR